MVAIAVAVASWDVRTSALVDLTETVAHAASIERADAVVDVVTDAIGIGVRYAVTATHAQGVELVAVAVAVASGDVRTSALVDLTWAVAHAASIERADAVVDVVTDAIGIGVRCAVTTTHAQGVELVAVAVAVSGWDVRTSALVDLTWATTNTAAVQHEARTVIDEGEGIVVARSLVRAAEGQENGIDDVHHTICGGDVRRTNVGLVHHGSTHQRESNVCTIDGCRHGTINQVTTHDGISNNMVGQDVCQVWQCKQVRSSDAQRVHGVGDGSIGRRKNSERTWTSKSALKACGQDSVFKKVVLVAASDDVEHSCGCTRARAVLSNQVVDGVHVAIVAEYSREETRPIFKDGFLIVVACQFIGAANGGVDDFDSDGRF